MGVLETTIGQYSVAEMGEALRRSLGKVYLTARQLHCSPQTVYNYLKRYPELKEIVSAERGKVVDTAELKLKQAVNDGDMQAVYYILDRLGRKRGYVKREEIDQKIKAEHRYTVDWDRLTRDGRADGNGQSDAVERRIEDAGRKPEDEH